MLDAVLQSKWDKMKAGESVVTNDRQLDELNEYFKNNDGPDADLFFGHSASRPNDKGVGTLDNLIAYIPERVPKKNVPLEDDPIATSVFKAATAIGYTVNHCLFYDKPQKGMICAQRGGRLIRLRTNRPHTPSVTSPGSDSYKITGTVTDDKGRLVEDVAIYQFDFRRERAESAQQWADKAARELKSLYTRHT